MRMYADLLRIRQWIKNAFVFVAAFFGAEFNLENLFELTIAFFAFSFVASAVYIFNDTRDAVNDRMHPTKKFRPIAAGTIKIPTAVSIAVFMMAIAVLLSWMFLNTGFLLIILIYFLLNILYSLRLKQVSIVDLLIVSSGFLLRVIGGAEVVSVEVSFWLLLMTFLFSMFIVIGKRRDDFKSGPEEAARLRVVNRSYNLYYLNAGLVLFSSLMIVCYIMYTYFSPYFQSQVYLALGSSILVLVGLMRYLQAIFVEDTGGSPTEFALKDRFIQVTVVLWLAIFGYLIYFH
jgi:decaprenyl-phosphate phosphoribosyltransferase